MPKPGDIINQIRLTELECIEPTGGGGDDDIYLNFSTEEYSERIPPKNANDMSTGDRFLLGQFANYTSFARVTLFERDGTFSKDDALGENIVMFQEYSEKVGAIWDFKGKDDQCHYKLTFTVEQMEYEDPPPPEEEKKDE